MMGVYIHWDLLWRQRAEELILLLELNHRAKDLIGFGELNKFIKLSFLLFIMGYTE